jgi:hypothetical protein
MSALTVLVLFSRLSGGGNATSSVAAEKVGPCFYHGPFGNHSVCVVQWELMSAHYFLQPPSLQ